MTIFRLIIVFAIVLAFTAAMGSKPSENGLTAKNTGAGLLPVPQIDIKTYSKFDFIPGEKIIFFDDFSQDPVGEFPAKWNTNNSGEVVTVDGFEGKWFQMNGDGGNYFPEFDLKFPDNVTIEFDLLFPETSELLFSYISEEEFDVDSYGVPGEAGIQVDFTEGDHQLYSYTNVEDSQGQEIHSSSDKGVIEPGKVAHVSVWIQKSRFRLYVGEEKVFDLPKGIFSKLVYNRIRFSTDNAPVNVLLSNIRIAVGAPDTRNQLVTEGKFVTRGILFDSGSDKIKPESYACIKEIATVLKENPDLKVTIIGHTDSDGDEAKNLDLSKRRAESVKRFLAQEFAIDAARMQTDGKGESQPAESNSTPEGKASNRRVEFIKI